MDEKYLGLPVPEGKLKNGNFKSLQERVEKRCSDWTEKNLSAGGKEVVIKSAVQALPTYAMNIFKFPVGVCEDLEQITRRWGDEDGEQKTHALACVAVTQKPRRNGI